MHTKDFIIPTCTVAVYCMYAAVSCANKHIITMVVALQLALCSLLVLLFSGSVQGEGEMVVLSLLSVQFSI